LLTEDLYVIGIGPGDLDSMSRQAYQTLKAVDIIVGYTTYIKCVEEIISKEQETYVSGMRKEKERVKKAI
jgi:precorrin-3B C17-methyltransferase